MADMKSDMKFSADNERFYYLGYDTGYADAMKEKDASVDRAYNKGYEAGFDDGFRAAKNGLNNNERPTPDEMIIDGMKRIRQGCAGREYCDTCPFAQWCYHCPEEWGFEV